MTGRLQLTKTNTYAHSGHADAAQFVSMHIARLLCQIFLHWEFLPFLPLRYTQPEGRKDTFGPTCGADQAPFGFWKNSARDCIAAAKDILHLASHIHGQASWPNSAFEAYGVFVANFIRIYAVSFPWMDTEGQMATPIHPGNAASIVESEVLERNGTSGFDVTSNTSGDEAIVGALPKWRKTLEAISQYFATFKTDFYSKTLVGATLIPANAIMAPDTAQCLRDGGMGEGREEYEIFESSLKDFGHL